MNKFIYFFYFSTTKALESKYILYATRFSCAEARIDFFKRNVYLCEICFYDVSVVLAYALLPMEPRESDVKQPSSTTAKKNLVKTSKRLE